MAIEDLDLEFEEEGEKSSGIIEIDEELSFNAGSANADRKKTLPNSKPISDAISSHGTQPKPEVNPPKQAKVSASDRTNPNLVIPKNLNSPSEIEPSFTNPVSNDDKVKDLGLHRQKKAIEASPKQVSVPVESSRPVSRAQNFDSSEAYDLNYASSDEVQFLREEVEKLRKEMTDVKIESEVRARVAEEKAKFMIEAITDAKMMNHKLVQVLQRINAKVPGLKNEVLMAKKILDEFMKKNSK